MMPFTQIQLKIALVFTIIMTVVPSAVWADIVMSQSSPSYDFGPSLRNRQYLARTATLRFTNTGADAQSGRVSLSTSSDDIRIEVAAFDIHVNPGETVHGYIDIKFTPSTVGQVFETINVATNFGTSSDQSIMAACYAGCQIEGNVYDLSTKEVISASECTSPSFEISNAKGYFTGHWFAGSYKFTVKAEGYYSQVKHIFLPENSKVPWNPELVPVIPLSEAVSTLQALSAMADPQIRFRIDLNQDGELGMQETVLYLQTLTELRRQNRNDLTSNLEKPFHLRQRHLSSHE